MLNFILLLSMKTDLLNTLAALELNCYVSISEQGS